MPWDCESSKEDIAAAYITTLDGFCPDCRLPLAGLGWCSGCLANWRTGQAEDGTPLLDRDDFGTCWWWLMCRPGAV